MKAILISIQPQWVEKILNGEKTIEIRKSVPSLTRKKKFEPIIVYIYCTKGETGLYKMGDEYVAVKHRLVHIIPELNGKVVAKFTLKRVYDLGRIVEYWTDKDEFHNGVEKLSCLTQAELIEYAGIQKDGLPSRLHAWYINNLQIFDKPMTIGLTGNPGDTFAKIYPIKNFGYEKCGEKGHCTHGQQGGTSMCDSPRCLWNCLGVQRAPQSWQFVEVSI